MHHWQIVYQTKALKLRRIQKGLINVHTKWTDYYGSPHVKNAATNKTKHENILKNKQTQEQTKKTLKTTTKNNTTKINIQT